MIGSPNPFAEEYSREDREEEAEKLQEEKEQRRAEREELEARVTAGDLFKLFLTPDLSKPCNIFVRYYDHNLPKQRHYVIIPNGRKERSEKKERAREKLKKAAAAAAALIPLSSPKIVVLGQQYILAQIVNLFVFIKSVIGGMF